MNAHGGHAAMARPGQASSTPPRKGSTPPRKGSAMSRHSWPVAAVAATAGLLVAACGAAGGAKPGNSVSTGGANPSSSASAKPDVGALRSRAIAAMKDARSVRLTGSLPLGAQRSAMDVVLIRAGGIAGTITSNGHSVQVLTSPGHLYIAVTKSLARRQKFPPAACSLLCGKWLKEPRADLQSFAGSVGW